GTLVLVTWQAVARNEWFRTIADAVSDRQPFAAPPPDAPGPFSLSEPARVRQLLGAAGFADVELDDVREPMYFGADADDAYAFICSLGFTKWKLSQLDAAGRARALDTLRQAIAAHDSSDGVLFESAVWITSARNGA
ncbi:MAG TPA: SAM-dependent methyltransferase, partial [Acidimicrobiia bacterium]|nr:SAM-dependent methyltransferase [Acidimicrobiia bacterium]